MPAPSTPSFELESAAGASSSAGTSILIEIVCASSARTRESATSPPLPGDGGIESSLATSMRSAGLALR